MENKLRSVLIWLFKVIKILGIKFGFIFPTLKAKLFLRMYGCEYGSNFRVCGKVYLRISKINSILIGENVTLIARFLTNTVGITNPIVLECIEGGEIVIGNNSGLTSAVISSRQRITIGDYVKIGGNARLFDHDFHSIDYLSRREGENDKKGVRSAEIVVGNDVFIGTNAIILKGVHIGARCIIAAGSVVTIKNIPDGSIVAGNPATIVGQIK